MYRRRRSDSRRRRYDAAVGAIADAGDTTVLKERLKEILFLAEELEAKGKAYNETVLKKRFIAEQYSRMTLKG